MKLNYNLGITYIKTFDNEKWFLAKDVAKCLNVMTKGLTKKPCVNYQLRYCPVTKRACKYIDEESLLYVFENDPLLISILKGKNISTSAYEIIIKVGLIDWAIRQGRYNDINVPKNWNPSAQGDGPKLELNTKIIRAPYGLYPGLTLLPKEISLEFAKELSDAFIRVPFIYIGEFKVMRSAINKLTNFEELYSKDYLRNLYNKGFPNKVNILIQTQWPLILDLENWLDKAINALPKDNIYIFEKRAPAWYDLQDCPTSTFE